MWRDRGETNVTDKKLADQGRLIIWKSWLTDIELLKIEATVKHTGVTEYVVAGDIPNVKKQQ